MIIFIYLGYGPFTGNPQNQEELSTYSIGVESTTQSPSQGSEFALK